MNVDLNEVLVQNILLAMNDVSFCKDTAARIVGGEKHLMRLYEEGKIKLEKRNGKKNGKWFCNAADVLRNVRDMRKLSRSQTKNKEK